MKKLTRIIIAKDMEDLVDDGRAEFKHWGTKRDLKWLTLVK